VAAALNAALSAELTAAPSDHTVVRIKVPAESRTAEKTVALLSKIGDVEVVPDLPSKVTINEKTGTIIVGEYVRVSPCVVAISELTIHVVDEEEVSQPQPGFNKGTTERVGRTRIEVNVGENEPKEFKGGSTISDVVRSLKALDASPRQMIEVFKELKASGYLHAELVVQ
jgi:flagellar P-ring protein precursor FlgI